MATVSTDLNQWSDRQLIQQFLKDRDDTVFAALTHRYGPMVMGVCQRILGDSHDAEDAFQATFLTLARRARWIIKKDSLRSWLYGVAQRTSLKLRSHNRRWAAKKELAMKSELAPVDASAMWLDVAPILDEELTQLAEKYRSAIVFCDLLGKSRAEAARELQVAEGTLSRRLSRGREALMKRLKRRGVTGTLAVLLTAFAESAVEAAVPPSLEHATIQSAVSAAGGEALASTSASRTVWELSDHAISSMWLGQIKSAATIATVGLAMTLGLFWIESCFGLDSQPTHPPAVQVGKERQVINDNFKIPPASQRARDQAR